MEFILSQTQTQVINRDVLQHVKILQMSGAELLEFVREIALENPVMEVEEPEEEPVSEDIERIKKLDWLSNYDEGYLYRQKDGDSDEFDITSYAKPVEATLADSLYQQLIGKPYSDQEFRIFFYIIHSLDSNGFFTVSPQEAAEQLSVPLAELERCLAAVKQLEPAGVCAGNLSECLYLQLERMNDDSLDVEKEIVLHHLSLLGKNHLNVIANRLNQPVSRIQLAKKRVQALNPRPASWLFLRRGHAIPDPRHNGKPGRRPFDGPDQPLRSAENPLQQKLHAAAAERRLLAGCEKISHR